MEAEWLGRGGADDLPNIETHAETKQLQFIYQRDVYAAIDVFQQLGHFRGRRRGNHNRAIENCTVHRGSEFGSLWIQPTDNFGNIAAGDSRVARIFALRRKGDEEFLSGELSSSRRLETRFVLFLAADDSRLVTNQEFIIDAGWI